MQHVRELSCKFHKNQKLNKTNVSTFVLYCALSIAPSRGISISFNVNEPLNIRNFLWSMPLKLFSWWVLLISCGECFFNLGSERVLLISSVYYILKFIFFIKRVSHKYLFPDFIKVGKKSNLRLGMVVY